MYSSDLQYSDQRNIVIFLWRVVYIWRACRRRSTFEFPSRFNLSGPSLYCTGTVSCATRLTWLDFRLNFLLLKGQRCGKYIMYTYWNKIYIMKQKTFIFCNKWFFQPNFLKCWILNINLEICTIAIWCEGQQRKTKF